MENASLTYPADIYKRMYCDIYIMLQTQESESSSSESLLSLQAQTENREWGAKLLTLK